VGFAANPSGRIEVWKVHASAIGARGNRYEIRRHVFIGCNSEGASTRTRANTAGPIGEHLSCGELPTNWQGMATYTGGVHFSAPGAFNRNFSVGATGKYEMWIAGSFPGRLRVLVDGGEVYSGHSVFEGNLYMTNPLSSVELSTGSHVLTVIYESPKLMSGSDSASEFGPIYFSSQNAGDVKVKRVSVSRISKLCTLNLDWIAIAN